MQAEIAALHHQLRILQRRTGARPRLRSIDRIFWTWLAAVVGLATRLGDRQTGDCSSLASPRLPALLAMEEPQARTGEAKGLA